MTKNYVVLLIYDEMTKN